MKILFIFLFLIVLHALYNLINFLRFPIIENNLMLTYSSDAADRIKAMTHKNKIVNYIKNAGVKDKYVPVVQPLGYGQLASANASVLDNILSPREDIARMAIQSILEAKGNYWSRFVNSINPLYWLKIILFIPKYTLSYLGVEQDKVIVKIFQLIYWFIGAVCTFALAIFPEEIKNFLQSIIHFS